MQHELLKNKSAQFKGRAVYKRSYIWEFARADEIHFGKLYLINISCHLWKVTFSLSTP
jgi:hypothetical protein